MAGNEPTDRVDGSVFDRTAAGYSHARRRLVPGFDDFYGALMRELRFDGAGDLTLADLGAGTGLVAGMLAERFPNARITLIDLSEPMLDQARARLGDDPRFTYRVGDLTRARLPKPADAVVSALAIHHLPDPDKISLYSRIYQSLRPGGVFVNAEQVAGENQVLQQRQHWAWLSDARALGASEEEIAAALVRMREDRPSPLSQQLEWMRKIGFANVDCTWRRGMFAVFSGEMPLDPDARPKNLFSIERLLKRES